MSVIYPDYLACPTWSYGDGTELFLNRTGYECGWTRQRKNIQDSYIQYSLSFLMDTREFNRWQQWVSENGYNWFTIKLDRVAGELEEEIIRFITPFTFSYNAYDIVAITVEAEQYNGKPNPPRQPEVPPESLPECQPYSCSAYEDYLIASGKTWAQSWTTSDIVDLPWPFAITPGDAGKLFLYQNYVSSPSLYTDWGGVPGQNGGPNGISTNVLDGNDPPDYCGGPLYSVGCFDNDTPIGPSTIVRQSFSGPSAEWGDHSAEAVIVGYNGNSTISGTFLRKSGSYYRWTRNGLTQNYDDPALIDVEVQSAGNDVTVTLKINTIANDGYSDYSDSFTVLDSANKFNLLSASIRSTSPQEIQLTSGPNAGKYAVARTVTVTASYAGQTNTISGTQVYAGFTNDPKTITGLTQRNHTFYTQPLCFYVMVGSMASLTWGAYDVSASGESKIAFDRNFAEYTPPGYCSP